MVADRSHLLAALAAIVATALLGACENTAPDASKSEQSSSLSVVSPSDMAARYLEQRTGSGAKSDQADVPHSEQRLCRFEVDGKVLVDGQCEVFAMGDGGYTLNSWTARKPPNSHFAVVIPQKDGLAEASWNADPDDDKAMDRLGIVTLQRGCWVNDRVRICAR